MMAAGPAAGGEAAEEKTEFDLVIDNVDADKRIAIIKVVRGLTDLGLKEAKDAVTNVPFTILAGKTKGEVEEAKRRSKKAVPSAPSSKFVDISMPLILSVGRGAA